MAVLTLQQQKTQLERDRKKIENLKRKKEELELKEALGEDWKRLERERINSEVESELGSTDTPKVYDISDRYDFFDPIVFLREKNESGIFVDFEAFKESLVKYKQALSDLQEKIDANQTEEMSKLEEDGIGLVDSLEFSDTVNGFYDMVDEDVEDLTEQAIEERKTAKKINDVQKARNKLNFEVSTYLSRIVPIFTKYSCSCCGKAKPIKNFFTVFDISCSGRCDQRGNFHTSICKECSHKLFAYYYQKTNRNVEETMFKMCGTLNIYWQEDVFQLAKQQYNSNGRKGTLVGEYIKIVNENFPGKTFAESKFVSDGETMLLFEGDNERDYDWTKDDYENKKVVLKMVGYDPFKVEAEDDKKILYKDLLAILDVGMENDFTKLQAAIQIVQGFFKLRKMNEKITLMEQQGAEMSEIKSLTDLKQKEMVSITNFARDNQFSTRYAAAQAKGENTFTGILNKANEQKFEKSFVNRYDIETSETIQQAAKASFKAIFEQLNLNESEIWKTCQDQLQEIIKLRKELDKTKEDLRIAKYQAAEVKLIEQQRLKEEAQKNLDGEL